MQQCNNYSLWLLLLLLLLMILLLMSVLLFVHKILNI